MLRKEAAAARSIPSESLLAVGITDVEGEFDAGDAVEVFGPDGRFLGKGQVAMDADAVRRSLGRHSSEIGGEVIHADDLVVLVG